MSDTAVRAIFDREIARAKDDIEPSGVIDWLGRLRDEVLEAVTPDPIESGQEAALAQWEERWRLAMEIALRAGRIAPGSLQAIAERIPTGKPMDLPHREVMRRTAELLGFEPDNHHNALRCPYCAPAGRVTFQLEPERVKRLLEVLRSAGAHPSGLGSYEAANDANALADDIELMTQ